MQRLLQEEQLKARQADWRKVLDEVKVEIGRKNYQQAQALLKGLPPELAKVPELSSEAQVLEASAVNEEARKP